MVTAPARRLLVRQMTSQGHSERRALRVVQMSARVALLCRGARSQRLAGRTNTGLRAPPSQMRRRHDLYEGASGGSGDQSRARRSTVRVGEAAGKSVQAQGGAHVRTPVAGSARRSEPLVRMVSRQLSAAISNTRSGSPASVHRSDLACPKRMHLIQFFAVFVSRGRPRPPARVHLSWSSLPDESHARAAASVGPCTAQ